MDRFLHQINEDQANNVIPSASDAFAGRDIIPTMATPAVATALLVRTATVTLRNVRRTVRGAEVIA